MPRSVGRMPLWPLLNKHFAAVKPPLHSCPHIFNPSQGLTLFSEPASCRTPAHNNVIHTHRNMAICRKNLCKSVRSVGDSEGQCGIMSVWRGMLCQPAGKKFPEPQLRSSGNCGYASCRHCGGAVVAIIRQPCRRCQAR